MSFALDHDYCAVMPSEKGFRVDSLPGTFDKEESNMAAEKQLPMEGDICGESANSDEIASLSSPAHSMDSGVDAGVEDLFADFPSTWKDEFEDFSWNDEDLKDLEALFGENFPTNELAAASAANSGSSGSISVLNSSTKLNVQFEKPKGMKMSYEDEQAIIEKNKKNAIAARENRQKKKKYVEGLENDVAQLKEQNKTLKTRNEGMATMIRKLSDEVKYLRSVLANESTISLLLKSVAATPGISLTSSLVQSSGSKEAEKESAKTQGERKYPTRNRKRRSDELTEVTPSKRTRGTNAGGVCLHVNSGKVSLELCAKCEMKASQSGAL